MRASGGRRGPRAGRVATWLVGSLLIGAAAGESFWFAKLEGVDGASRAAGREGWIDLFGAASAVRSESVDDERTDFQPAADRFGLWKVTDRSSPYLVEALLRGREFPELRVEEVIEDQVVACFVMRGVRVASHELIGEPSYVDTLESFGFAFDAIEWHSFRQGDEGETLHVGTTWDFATGQGGVLEQHGGEVPTIAPIDPLEATPGQLLEVPLRVIDPGGDPDGLEVTALPSELGLLQVLGIEGDGESRTLRLQVGDLRNGSDRLTLRVSDGLRSSTRTVAVLVAGERTPYEAFIEAFLANRLELNPEIAGLLYDPDGDRMSNVMEFFLGTDPGTFTRSGEAMELVRRKVEGGTEIRLRFFRRANAGSLAERFEGSGDLRDWTPLGATSDPALESETIGDAEGDYLPTEARIFLPTGRDERFFLRLAVEGAF